MQRLGSAFPGVLGAAQVDAPWAYERLFEAFAPSVHGYLRIQGVTDAEEITNEVFVGAFRNLGSFEGDEDEFTSWLFTIAYRRLQDWRRQAGRRVQVAHEAVADDDVPGGDVEDEVMRRLSEERVRELLGVLPPDQRDVLILRMVADLSIEQVAAAVGKRPGAVKALQRRGLAGLRRKFEREGVSL